MNSSIFSLQNITRSFKQGDATLEVLRGVDLTLRAGEVVALVGPSGSGKSTLLQIAGLLEPPTSGAIHIAGVEASTANERQRTELRRTAIGFVYQFHHLLPEFSALENIVLPQMIDGVSKRSASDYAREILDKVGLGTRHGHRPGQLSGGEQQRVAIARALANRPKILLADEPTGNLDEHTADGVFELLTSLVRASGLSALIATHNPQLAARMDRTIELRDGRLI